MHVRIAMASSTPLVDTAAVGVRNPCSATATALVYTVQPPGRPPEHWVPALITHNSVEIPHYASEHMTVGAVATAVDRAVNGHFFPQMTKCTQCALDVAADAADLISPSQDCNANMT